MLLFLCPHSYIFQLSYQFHTIFSQPPHHLPQNLLTSLIFCGYFELKLNKTIFDINIAQQFQSSCASVMSKQKAPEPPRKSQIKQTQAKVEPKKESDAEKYLKQLSAKTQSFDKLTRDTELGEKHVLKSIKKGQLEIKQVPNDLGAILIKQHIDEEEKKANDLRRKREQILQAIQRLDMRRQKSNQSFKTLGKQYSNPDLLNYKPNSILTKEEHETLVDKIKQAQQIQDQRNEQRLYRLQKSYQEETEKLQKLEQEKLNEQKQLRRRKSEYKLSLRQQINQLQNAEELRSKKQLLQLKKKSHLHQALQEKYHHTMVIPSLEEKKKKLKQIRELNRSFKVKELDSHEQKYMKQRNNSMHLLQSKVKLSEQWSYKPPARTQKLSKILQKQLSDHKKQLEKDKKAVEEKILRQDNYIRLLKQKHMPKIDQNKQKQLEHRIQQIHTRRRQTDRNPRDVGMNYLVEAKKLKKNSSKQLIQQKKEVKEAVVPQLQSSRSNYLVHSENNEYYRSKRQENLQKILKSDIDATQKAHQLELENKKIEQAYKRKDELIKCNSGSIETRKDAAELLLSGIKAKMGLIKLVE